MWGDASFIFSRPQAAGTKELSTDVAEFAISAEELKRLAQLVEENRLSELRVEEGDLRVTLRTASYRSAFGPVATTVAVSEPVAAAGHDTEDNDADLPATRSPAASSAHLLRVEAPIMGVFYRTPGPDEPAFVEVGDTVEVGQVIGVIEAMKVFSEVLSDHAGRVREIPAKNGGLVQPGEPLVVLEAV
jgi:acetyl-CoA carboxylase biotin carboxyl carrier protein